MLLGDINYSQVIAEIAFDSELLQFAGYENLRGWVAACAPVGVGRIALRSVPTSSMATGVPCSEALRIVTLKFTVQEGSTRASAAAGLSFNSLTISPPAGYIGATTALGQDVSISIQQ